MRIFFTRVSFFDSYFLKPKGIYFQLGYHSANLTNVLIHPTNILVQSYNLNLKGTTVIDLEMWNVKSLNLIFIAEKLSNN